MNSFGPHLLTTLLAHLDDDDALGSLPFRQLITKSIDEGWRFGGWVLRERGADFVITAMLWRGEVAGLTMLSAEFKTMHQTWQDLL